MLIAEKPSADMVASGIDPRILRPYHGVPLNHRSVVFGAPHADTIYLFCANLERVSSTRPALLARIRVVTLHETAHFFGWTDAQLQRLGLV